jgi:hypothetical protein
MTGISLADLCQRHAREAEALERDLATCKSYEVHKVLERETIDVTLELIRVSRRLRRARLDSELRDYAGHRHGGRARLGEGAYSRGA